MGNKSFTSNVAKDKPADMRPEEYKEMYAAWGKFIELSGSLIPWDKFIDYIEPVDEVIGETDDGKLLVKTTIGLVYTQVKP